MQHKVRKKRNLYMGILVFLFTVENLPDVQVVDITLISCFTRATNPDLVFVLVQEVADFPDEKRHRRRKIAHAT